MASPSVVLDMFLEEDEEYDHSYSMSSPFRASPSPPPPLPVFSNLLSDVSESSSDDDLIHKLSHDLELPLALDDFEPVSSWSSHSPGDIFQTFTNQDSVSSALKSENDFSAEELTQALYPNLVAGQEAEHETISSVLIEDKIIKKEPSSPQHFLQMPPSPDDSHDIWELLCGPDIKPNVKALDTPPVTPPQSEGSPPHSPQPLSPAGPTATTVVLSPPHQHQKQGTNGMTANHITQPIKVVTITTRNGTTNQGATKGGRITKTMKIQPKIVTTSTTQPQVISIVNSSSGPKLTLPKTVGTRTISTGGSTRVVQLKPPPQVQSRVTTATPTIPSPVPSILTSQITNQPTVIGTQSSVVPPAAPTTPLAPLAPALAPGMKHGNVPDLKALKRQQRMIKNRESASLSRKKKKEYVTALEGNITDLQNENKRLKEDNIRLQQKVSSLESECASLRHALGRSPSRKTTTALFAIIFLLSLNLGPLTGIFLSNESRLSSLKRMMQGVEPSSLGTGFKHRSLLWADEKQASAEEGTIPNLNTNTSSMCPMYINATESLRLETELRGWFENKMDKKKNSNQRPLLSHPKTREGRNRLKQHKNVGEPSQKLSKQVGNEVWNALVPPQQPSNKPAPLYHYVHYVEPSTSTEEDTSVMATVPRLTSFLEAIQRRDDTYYVVSFSPDHLLVPATARNDSARPRMSLLMPTPQSMNDSLAPPPNNVALMQIDCEVMHTRLVHVAQELVPPYLRTDRSNTSRTSSEEATTATPRERRNSRSRPRHTLTKPAFPHK
ncbi:cyclic AMP-dependent transcription factor ATF-6 alpha-like isoform X3 [Penaeus chinensis]|uniref:cyclic AMP-dependent transcription factor ATF-6 alpha-like isoform X3 n=1 Tax=Penaeus chinensis TaxID=139456 RepID=UPI001FB68D50|nr:cyclic AMP-dependent transcription factor ATF-6 alpha-like isoform X3 [Penaeus chinensis]